MTERAVKYIEGCAPCALHDKDSKQRGHLTVSFLVLPMKLVLKTGQPQTRLILHSAGTFTEVLITQKLAHAGTVLQHVHHFLSENTKVK